MELTAVVGFAALGLLVAGWLAISFSEPGRRREPLEWACASALYLALLMLFVRGIRWALAADSTAGLVGFGFLCALFGPGLFVCLWNAIRSRGPSKAPTSATN